MRFSTGHPVCLVFFLVAVSGLAGAMASPALVKPWKEFVRDPE